MISYKTPSVVKKLFPDMVWQMPSNDQTVYLTFDDGPVPYYTEYVLELLENYQAKATFFCVGDNIKRHPDIFAKVLEGGHMVGSHTHHHVSGWSLNLLDYLNEARTGSSLMKSRLFRPPYGKISLRQANVLSRHFTIVMWDVLSGDFLPYLTAEECAQNVLTNVNPGSIIVFHDSQKSFPRLKKALPLVLKNLRDRGYTLDSLHRLNSAPQKRASA